VKIEDFINMVDECCNDVTFSFQGKSAGIVPEVNNYSKIFHVWYGDKTKDYLTVQDVMADQIFDGQSLRNIFDNIDVNVE
jgi:hypothetical protein